MSDTNQPFITTKLHFLTQADQEAFDVSGIKDGAVCFVRSGIANIDDPDNTNRPYWVYDEDNVGAPGAAIRVTANSQAGALRGRWLRINLAPNIAP